MTLIVVLLGADCLVLAGDSRSVTGNPAGLMSFDDTNVKIKRLNDFCGVGIAGDAGLATKILDDVMKQSLGTHQATDSIVTAVSTTAKARYNDWFDKTPSDQRPGIIFQIAGYHRPNKGDCAPRVYQLSSGNEFAPSLTPTPYGFAGIPQYANYLNGRLRTDSMQRETLCRLAHFMITETSSQDFRVGGPVKLATISADSPYEELTDQEVQDISQQNADVSAKLRGLFSPGGNNGQA